MHQSQSPSPDLSSPLSSPITEPNSQPATQAKFNHEMDMDEIIVDPSQPRLGETQATEPEVRLTAAGLPRKKPGRKPGSTVKSKNADGAPATDAPKVRRPRKPRDPNAPPVQRKRKGAPTQDDDSPPGDSKSLTAPGSRQPSIAHLVDPDTSSSARRTPSFSQHEHVPQKAPKREELPRSMQSILNADPEPPHSLHLQRHQSNSTDAAPAPAATSTLPTRTSGQSYDPIRGNYDPVRGIFGSATSPRSAAPVVNRASASPSIASLVDPIPNVASPSRQPPQHASVQQQQTQQARGSVSRPTSPLQPARAAPPPVAKTSVSELKKHAPSPPASNTKADAKPKETTLTASATASKKPSPRQKPQKSATVISSPKLASLDETPLDHSRSILDFGKAEPGMEIQAPSIVLHIPLKAGETNKYVNFMREAEARYGWDALHPRLAAQRDRKARIAAASAALEKAAAGQESGDEMSEDSDKEASNVEMGGMASGQDVVEKPKKKKRNFKEDEYDKDDDFVDDSELLWEEQAAASRDGFFVYSGPLISEPEKPANNGNDGPPKRGRGSRGGRGGRGGAARGGAEGGTGRGGGPGSRGGRGSRGGSAPRKPRITKSEKEQLEREKAERQKLGEVNGKSGNAYSLQPQALSLTGVGA
ncbi:HPC2-domain-containing protein [Sodiomyces alkalinus F11]|uniref:HPC2-domain-containing protein n=1 Tax=Sodiomyces alkalinus (strain CBS 110278 / VKM F-3762 / F11) TaxID=1314773 RepID=A0A3N2Q7N0_SODAK|nr:HPC2-domain-containing protein [Sodiomyces alkalinus F11]ROT42752.1 HPC2-domain-containing protein [Sodiomyces alkalinus F11]